MYSETVLGYQRKGLQDHEVIDFQTLELPTVEFPTRALWYELDELIAAEPFPPGALLGALHALEHGQIAVLPLIAMCDRWDIGGLSTNAHPQTGGPTIFIYDGHPGGVGITRRGYDQFERLVGDAAAADRRVPVPARLPVVRAVAEVRQPQRAAVQARRARAAGAAAGPAACLTAGVADYLGSLRAIALGRTYADSSALAGESSLQAQSNVSVASAPVGNFCRIAARSEPSGARAPFAVSRSTSSCIAGLWPITITEAVSSGTSRRRSITSLALAA